MKLPAFSVRKKQKELYLSLLLYPDAVDAAAWELDSTGEAFISGAVTQELSKDNWEERNDAADKCVSTLEAITKTENINKVILGLPAEYLTEDGDVKKDVKQHIKKLTHLLELSPIGFVSIYQAIIHQFKHKEGVPPSLILLGVTGTQLTVTLYKVGNFLGHRVLPVNGSLIGHLEDALSSFTDIEILPSRIIIYGTDRAKMEDAKRQILDHHWHQKTNFLHFPKAEILSGDGAAISVSFAGAAELAQTMTDDNSFIENEDPDQLEEETEEMQVHNEEITEDPEEVLETDEVAYEDEELKKSTRSNEEMIEEIVEETELEPEEKAEEIVDQGVFTASRVESDFRMDDDIGFSEVTDEELEEVKSEPSKSSNVLKTLQTKIPALFIRKPNNTDHKHTGKKKAPLTKIVVPVVVVLLLVLGLVYFLFTQVLPQAQVEISVVPRTVQASERITIATSESNSSNTVSGKVIEQTVSGDKTIQVTGKKTVGDAAKGTVTIFNKSLLPRTFKKGTVLSTGSIEFTLDSDTSIASASETFSGSTFGKANASVTAREIGSRGNISAGREFTISGVSTSIATARNEAAFTGGTSKEMTVVSRADQDNLIKQLTSDLVAEARNGFAAGDGEQLIPDTIKTQVKERTFSHEVGQEVKELKGSATVLITGTAFSENDIKSVMKNVLSANVSNGYRLLEDSIELNTDTPIVGRSGAISTNATSSARLVPSFEVTTLAEQIRGKSVSEAEAFIKGIDGVGAVRITVSNSLFRNMLPSRIENIKVSLETNQ